MARERARAGRTSSVPEWWLREAAALLACGVSLFLLVSLWSSGLTGQVGRHLAMPLREFFGLTAFLVPIAGLAAALNAMRSRPAWSTLRWAAGLGLMGAAAILVELPGLASSCPSYTEPARPHSLGGIAGQFLATVLCENFGVVGSYCFLVPLLLLMILATTSTSIGEGVAQAASLLRRAGDRVTAWFETRRRESPPEIARVPRAILAKPNVRKNPAVVDPPPPILVAEPPRRATEKSKKASQEAFLFAGTFNLPSLNFLDPPVHSGERVDEQSLIASSRILESKLADFGVQGKVTAVRPGPVINTFEFEPAPGVKVNRIVTLADDLSMALRAMSVRILAPIPGKSVVGIELSNPRREKVFLREILESDEFHASGSKLTLALGKDSVGKPMAADLARMPHVLVAGATGTGKSVSLNAMIMSILFKATPDDVRFLMIDPKMLELSLYENIPHLLTRVVIDPREASAALTRAVIEMENRYKLLRDKGVRNIDSYNRVLENESEEKSAGVIELKDAEPNEPAEGSRDGENGPVTEKLVHRRLPYIVIVIDELADLMLTSGREVEEQITRLAQKARAAGIHLILATQRPSVDVITGLIKANVPARISFQVTSRIDSRTILDSIGAERLLGDGDMLFMPPSTPRLTRIHGAYVSEPEIRKVVGYLKDQSRPVYDQEFTRAIDEAHEEKTEELEDESLADDMYDQAVQLVAESQQASISWLQRRLRVGYNRAARMIERMEKEGLVSPADGVRPREVRMRRSESL
ncbi:MAG TPA: DNA translocase FtsK 4TM domain-containing protein [Candidatus Binatia bacterium]|nr:DNA translocase FtsK 4TM domain-containing protein [Candidatus Binatia bacterium]